MSTGAPRILVVGHGLIGQRRASAVAALERTGRATLAGTVDPVARDASLYGGAPHYADLATAGDDFDAAVVAVPHDAAAPLATAILEGGRPVLLEKPLGVRGEQARALEALARRVDRPSFVGYDYRYLPGVAGMLETVAHGGLGRLRNVDLLLGHGGHPGSAESWKLSPERSGGGVLLDPGVHMLDLLLLLDPQIENRFAAATRGFWPTGIEEDLVLAFSHGSLLATVRISHVRWVNKFSIEVGGEEGYAIVEGRGGNYGPQTLRVGRRWAWNGDEQGRSQRQTEQVSDFGTQLSSLADELAAVVAIWSGEAAPDGPVHPATMAEARRVTELCDTLYAQLPAA